MENTKKTLEELSQEFNEKDREVTKACTAYKTLVAETLLNIIKPLVPEKTNVIVTVDDIAEHEITEETKYYKCDSIQVDFKNDNDWNGFQIYTTKPNITINNSSCSNWTVGSLYYIIIKAMVAVIENSSTINSIADMLDRSMFSELNRLEREYCNEQSRLAKEATDAKFKKLEEELVPGSYYGYYDEAWHKYTRIYKINKVTEKNVLATEYCTNYNSNENTKWSYYPEKDRRIEKEGFLNHLLNYGWDKVDISTVNIVK